MTKIKYTSSNEVDFVAGYNVKVVNGKIVFESIEDYNERKANEKALRMKMSKKYQMMYYLNDESCAGTYTEDELAQLLSHVDVANSFTFIGIDTDVWKDKEFRERVCDKALAIIREREDT